MSESGRPGRSGRPARLKVGVIGAGRVGAVLGAALQQAGHRVVAASGVSARSSERAADLLDGIDLTDPFDVAGRADLLLVAVPDDALEPLITGLSEARAVPAGTLVAHTSGRYGADVLTPLTRIGALPLALHPVMTFTGTRVDLARLAGCCFGVTAPEPLRPVAEALVVEMGSEPQWVEEDKRALYHAALANGANHLVTLVAQSGALLAKAGVENPSRLLGPLLGAALDNALRSGDLALTGPVARGDAATVAVHIQQIAAVSPEAAAAYVAMARLTADRALVAGLLTPDAASSLLAVLGHRHPFEP
ncbi:DUF2520 domain-containing protein [Sporichthya sp.]|uniref:Rossmann-like and DUF2520 domain-containing protein n=1 Tax=Sporichthya sp. TaxID=65475 RepID=UPI0018448B7B|nr:DUF2520 domain-containing protein [Sporichthya sp.]MBA3744003.1 DUF2520 domain-containing protein [Sporichthya sp.]